MPCDRDLILENRAALSMISKMSMGRWEPIGCAQVDGCWNVLRKSRTTIIPREQHTPRSFEYQRSRFGQSVSGFNTMTFSIIE
jgi:hypothetical protein